MNRRRLQELIWRLEISTWAGHCLLLYSWPKPGHYLAIRTRASQAAVGAREAGKG
jgi:hypothetical protein